MTDKKAKKIGLSKATRLVALANIKSLGQPERVTHIRLRRSANGIHVSYVLRVPGGEGVKVTSFCPRHAIKLRVRWTA